MTTKSAEFFRTFGGGYLPGLVGVEIVALGIITYVPETVLFLARLMK